METDALPPKYTKYDWLRTSGHNARIDTGVSGDDETLQIKCTLMPVVLVDSNISVFGNYKSYSDHYCWRCMTTGTSSSDYYRMYMVTAGNNSPNGGTYGIYTTGTTNHVGDKMVIDMSYGECTLTGRTVFTRTIPYAQKTANPTNIALGSLHPTNVTNSNATQFRIYNFKLWSHGKLVRNYIPCVRKSDNKAGFYDSVNHTFNPSIGSVDFVAGND